MAGLVVSITGLYTTVSYLLVSRLTRKIYNIKKSIIQIIENNNFPQSQLNRKDKSWFLGPEYNELLDKLVKLKTDLLESEQYFKTLFNLSPIPLGLFSDTGKLLSLNKRFEKDFGYSIEDIPTLDDWWKKAYPDENYRQETISKWNQAIKNTSENKSDVLASEFNITCKNGDIRTISIAGIKINNTLLSTFSAVTERNKAEEELLKSKQILLTILNYAPIGMWMQNESGRMLFVNKEFCDKIGISEIKFRAVNHYSELFTTEVAKACMSSDCLAMKSDGPITTFEQLPFTDGKTHFTEIKKIKVLDQNNKIVGLIGLMRDITDSKISEDKLRVSEQKFRLLLDSTEQGIYGVNTVGECIFANKSCLNMFGYKEESELLGKLIHNYVHHTKANGTPYPSQECKMYQALSDFNGVHVCDEVFWRKDGSSFPVEYWSHPIIINDKIEGAVATFFDISTRLKVDEELRRSNERYDFVSKAINNSIWEMDFLNNEITRIGNGFNMIFGYSPELTNDASLHWHKLMHPDDFYRIKESLQQTIQNSNEFRWDQDYRFMKADGKYAFVNDKGYIVRDEKGIAIRMIGAMTDISERVNFYKTIELQNSRLREIAWTQSHIVRSPLTRMMGIAYQLNKIEKNSEEFGEWVLNFQKSAKELDEVIREIVNSSTEFFLMNEK